jgi:putative transposase
MTRKNGDRSLAEIKALLEEESDFLRPMVRAVIQEFLEAEMAEAVGAEKGERIEGRLSYRSGYYTRSLVTRVGKLELRVPQDRNGRFSTEIFERYQRSEKGPGGGAHPDVHPRGLDPQSPSDQ